MWQLCCIPYQHHHLLHQGCATQCERILRASIKCCHSNLDQTQFSGLSCKSVLCLQIWKSRFVCSSFCFATENCLYCLETEIVSPKNAVCSGLQHKRGWEITLDSPLLPLDSGSWHPDLWTENREVTAAEYSLLYHCPIHDISGIHFLQGGHHRQSTPSLWETRLFKLFNLLRKDLNPYAKCSAPPRPLLLRGIFFPFL